MKYKHAAQKPYCCVPACVSMLLVRRGIKPPKQEDIAYDLGIVLPPNKRHLLPRSHNAPKEKSGYGTRIHLKPYSLTSFFKKRKYKLQERYYSAKSFKNADAFRNFLQKKLDKKNDLLVCFDQGRLKERKESFGHCTLISKVTEKSVFMFDPDSSKSRVERRVPIKDLFGAAKNHYKGGVWVISPK